MDIYCSNPVLLYKYILYLDSIDHGCNWAVHCLSSVLPNIYLHSEGFKLYVNLEVDTKSTVHDEMDRSLCVMKY